MYIYESYLAHHGVKGMKWGHRKEKVKQSVRRFGNSYVNAAHNVINNKGAARKQFKRNIVGGIGKSFLTGAALGAGISAATSLTMKSILANPVNAADPVMVAKGLKMCNAIRLAGTAAAIGIGIKRHYEYTKRINKAAETGVARPYIT